MIVLVGILGACWGSFLNVVATRLLHDVPLSKKRSACFSCQQTIAWYDLIPVFSWFILKGRCRSCRGPISWLYPFIELLTAVLCLALYLSIPAAYLAPYGLFISALIVTIRTDLEAMVILRYFSLWLMPLGWFFAGAGLLPITLIESLLGSLAGYSILALPAYIFKKVRGIEGMGDGDPELLAMIGAFLGPLGAWFSVLIGSVIGSCVGIALALAGRSLQETKIPYGPLLAAGALGYLFFSDYVLSLFPLVNTIL